MVNYNEHVRSEEEEKELPVGQTRMTPTYNVGVPYNIRFMTDEEIDTFVDEKTQGFPDDIYHVGIAPFDAFVGLTKYISTTKKSLKDLRDAQNQYM